jgi:plasmid stability protein
MVEKWRNPMATLNIKDFPDGVYRKLKARAKRDHRSLAQEVTHI